jgi:hypothetical protein
LRPICRRANDSLFKRSVTELDTGEAALIRLMDAVLCEERPS